jgi:hypothetical protein
MKAAGPAEQSTLRAPKSLAVTAKHSSENTEHVTPLEVANAARGVLEVIDLDPASCELANSVIRARAIYTKEYDGLAQTWRGRVFLNPPGGLLGGESQPKVWWNKLANAWLAGTVECAIFLGFSIEFLQVAQLDTILCPLEFPLCVPHRRLRFLHVGEAGKLVPGDSPTHANVIVYLPPRWDLRGARFDEHFAPIGKVRL